MKRLKALVMVALFVVFAAGTIYADDITVTVTMATYSLSVSDLTWAIGEVTPSEIKTRAQASYVKNSGGVNMDVTLLCGEDDWKLGSSAVGKDTFLMRAYFARPDTTAAVADSFLANDALTGGAQEGTNALFYWGGGGLATDAGGLDIAAGDSVTLWLWFRAPTTSTTVAQQSIAVTVGGKVAD